MQDFSLFCWIRYHRKERYGESMSQTTSLAVVARQVVRRTMSPDSSILSVGLQRLGRIHPGK